MNMESTPRPVQGSRRTKRECRHPMDEEEKENVGFGVIDLCNWSESPKEQFG